jgi:hypothetical protein
MSRSRWLEQQFCASVSLGLLALACAGSPGQPDAAVAGSRADVSDASAGTSATVATSGSTSTEPSGGQAGNTAVAGGTSGGASGVAAGGSAPSSGGASASAGGASAGSGGGAGPAGPVLTTKDFACTEVIGLWVASQWWDSFEKGVENPQWQFMFQHHGYLELFADPASEFWGNAVSSKCAASATTPDRVVFLPFSLTLNTLEQWSTNLTNVVEAMKTKFPGVKRIELMTTLRGPGNMPCANDTDPNTTVAPYVDQAIQMVADASGGLVTVGPKIELASCDWWAGGTDLSGAGNTGAGQLLAAYYQTH